MSRMPLILVGLVQLYITGLAHAQATHLYWTDSTEGRIYRSDLVGGPSEVVYETGVRDPGRMSLGPAGQKIYWVDPTNQAILRANVDGTNIEVMLGTPDVDVPEDIVVDSVGNLYFTDSGRQGVFRSDVSGTTPVLLHSTINAVGGLDLDEANQTIWFAHTNYWRVSRVQTDGTGFQLGIWTIGPTDVVVDGSILYVSTSSGIEQWFDDGTYINHFETNWTIDSLAHDPIGNTLYYFDWGAQEIFQIDEALSASSTFKSGLASTGLACNPATGQLYYTEYGMWLTNNGAIVRANLDGTGEELLAEKIYPRALLVHAGLAKVYWSNSLKYGIQRANFDGSGAETLYSGTIPITGIELDETSGKIYFAEPSLGRIMRMDPDGSDQEEFLSNLQAPADMTIDTAEGWIYWVETLGAALRRHKLDGSGSVETMQEGLLNPTGVDLNPDSGWIYLADGGELARYDPTLHIYQVLSSGNGASTLTVDPAGAIYYSGSGGLYQTSLIGLDQVQLTTRPSQGMDLWDPATTSAGGPPVIPATLYPATPNPFNPRTTIRFELTESVSSELAIYDSRGRLVRQLMPVAHRNAGLYRVSWDGRDDAGTDVASGVYLYRLRAGDESQAEKMVLVR